MCGLVGARESLWSQALRSPVLRTPPSVLVDVPSSARCRTLSACCHVSCQDDNGRSCWAVNKSPWWNVFPSYELPCSWCLFRAVHSLAKTPFENLGFILKYSDTQGWRFMNIPDSSLHFRSSYETHFFYCLTLWSKIHTFLPFCTESWLCCISLFQKIQAKGFLAYCWMVSDLV